jgi:mono/diheme cytochrome c family protein
MTANPPPCPSPDEAPMSDEALLTEHEKLTGPQPDEHAHYRLLPLAMILVLSSCVLFAATYLNRYSGHFSASIYNENLLPSKGAPVAFKVDPVVFGDKLYHSAGACITCHQPTGQGIPGVYPPLAGSEWVNGAEDRVIRIVLYGLQGPVRVAGKDFGSAAMPVFGQVANSGYNWTDEKIAAVLTYVRQEWGNKAPPISAEAVSSIRKAVGDRPSWSQEDLLKIK